MNSVDQINKEALQYNHSVSPVFREIVQPLFDYMGLNHFGYSRLMNGNRYMVLCLDSDWTERYFEKDLEHQLLFDEVPLPKNSKKIVLWDLHPNTPMMQSLRSMGYDHGVSIYYHHDNCIEGWHFATRPNNKNANMFYMMNLEKLEQFILYVQEKAFDLINRNDDFGLAIYKHNHQIDLNRIPQNLIDELHTNDFMSKIAMNQYSFRFRDRTISLTPTEFACLKGIAEGQTAKCVAREKQLSPRTVESVINRIRCKFGAGSKSHLVDLYKKSIYWLMD